MPEISFDSTGFARFQTRHHGEVTLSKTKWDKICAEPERTYYRSNGDKIGTTLVNPDVVRVSSHYPHQFHYYKKFSTMKLGEHIEVPTGRFPFPYFCVIVDESTKRVCTSYPVPQPKPGKDFKPRHEKGT